MSRYLFYPQLDLVAVAKEISDTWKKEQAFQHSVTQRKNNPQIRFYEGPPGANGKPGIHHLFSRTLKDLFCRYKTMRGFCVERKSGWDTHGLPVELAVEKELKITKEDIGKKITIADYNAHCKKAVMRYQKAWEDMTQAIGYWLDLKHPYVTCAPNYVSALWGLLKKLYQKGYLYKGYSIQPYSPAAGTGLSNHELNQPGCYKDVKDTAIVAQFALKEQKNTYLLAWTTTPWTLPANSALAIDPKLRYVKIKTYNRYTKTPICVILAEAAVERYFDEKQRDIIMSPPVNQTEPLPWTCVDTFLGNTLVGYSYVPLFSYVKPSANAFQVVPADFITTTEGTGVVHIAPTFGADDYRLAQQHGIPAITVPGKDGRPMPIVDKKGRFVAAIADFAGAYVKEAYDPQNRGDDKGKSTDVSIAIKLKKENKAFQVARYLHAYPHCWRTDKPILYYPLQAWFIKTTACKKRLIELNKTIQWHPKSAGTGRFGDWLAHLVDWNITRDRFWGTPLPIWRTKDGKEEKCIGCLAELRNEVKKAVEAGFMADLLPVDFDPHRPYVDEVILVSDTGRKMYREEAVVDVWFDSGGMPYAQHSTDDGALSNGQSDIPADFIIEGVDQTRGWFFTLHALAVLLYDKVAFKHVLAAGLVLDKQGQKMSKRLGNTIDPVDMLATHGPDVVRWYTIVNADPWDGLKFDVEGLKAVHRKFFGTLYNTYQFFVLYANIDDFKGSDDRPDVTHLTQSDRWILSKLQKLIQKTTQAYDAFSPTEVGRAIQYFVVEELSNWYVRLNRKRFWQGGYSADKVAAYTTLHYCLRMVAVLAAPIAPFYMDRLYRDLNGKGKCTSVHLKDWPMLDKSYEDNMLEQAMYYAQKVCSLVHSLRKKHGIKVRQPLKRVLLALSETEQKKYIDQVGSLILSEVNVKEIALLEDIAAVVHKEVKPNFPRLGKVYGAQMQAIKQALCHLNQKAIALFEEKGTYTLRLQGKTITLSKDDVVITTKDIAGWAVARQDVITVALDLAQPIELVAEGIARELVNRIQHIRKEAGLAVEEKIELTLATEAVLLQEAFETHKEYIMEEVQACAFAFSTIDKLPGATTVTLAEGVVAVSICKHF